MSEPNNAVRHGDLTPYLVCLAENDDGVTCGKPYRHDGPHRGTPRTFLVRMPADLHAAVKETAEKEDRTMAAVAREALRAYIKTVSGESE